MEDWLLKARPRGWDSGLETSGTDIRPAEKCANYQAFAGMMGVELLDRHVCRAIEAFAFVRGTYLLGRESSLIAAFWRVRFWNVFSPAITIRQRNLSPPRHSSSPPVGRVR